MHYDQRITGFGDYMLYANPRFTYLFINFVHGL